MNTIANKLSKKLKTIPGDILIKIISKISKIDEFKGWFKGALKLGPQILTRLKKSTVITSTGSSTRIEGSSLTDKEVEKLLKGLKISKLTDRDSQEVAGYAEALECVFDNYKSMSLSEGLIFQLHNMILKYSEKDRLHKGKYKTTPNKVVAIDNKKQMIFNTTKPHLTPYHMIELIEWTRKNLIESEFHPLIIIANFIVEFLAIHPFKDGNGRISRIITNLLLLQHEYKYVLYASLEKIIEGHKGEYYVALRKGQTRKREISAWIIFFLNTLLQQIDIVKDLINDKSNLNLLSVSQENVMKLFEVHEEITNKIVKKELKIPGITAIQIFNRLIDLKLISKKGSGRSTRYSKS